MITFCLWRPDPDPDHVIRSLQMYETKKSLFGSAVDVVIFIHSELRLQNDESL